MSLLLNCVPGFNLICYVSVEFCPIYLYVTSKQLLTVAKKTQKQLYLS